MALLIFRSFKYCLRSESRWIPLNSKAFARFASSVEDADKQKEEQLNKQLEDEKRRYAELQANMQESLRRMRKLVSQLHNHLKETTSEAGMRTGEFSQTNPRWQRWPAPRKTLTSGGIVKLSDLAPTVQAASGYNDKQWEKFYVKVCPELRVLSKEY